MPMYEHPNQFTRYDAQAMESRLLKEMKVLRELIQKIKEKRQATYTVQQFADATGLTYDCVLQKCRRGKLRARQDGPGSRWTINGEELERYLAEGLDNRW